LFVPVSDINLLMNLSLGYKLGLPLLLPSLLIDHYNNLNNADYKQSNQNNPSKPTKHPSWRSGRNITTTGKTDIIAHFVAKPDKSNDKY